jgi:hypothetical protein
MDRKLVYSESGLLWFHCTTFFFTETELFDFGSARHTIQRDPTLYNDEITSYFGAKPELLKHPMLAWR